MITELRQTAEYEKPREPARGGDGDMSITFSGTMPNPPEFQSDPADTITYD